MNEILLTEKGMVFLVLVYFHGETDSDYFNRLFS